MVYISRIKIKGFKSFKNVDFVFPKDFICFVGPNGSGKSNICDAIRFAFGETSLKSMRAKKIKDLINHDSKIAEVTVYLDGEEKHEIKRAIREDGKIIYKVDGKRVTKTSLLNLLRKFNIDSSGRNIIAQGEVTKIIEMSGKERRQIIESVAGISEFEEKKREALKELEIVDQRLKEVNIVLGEKFAFLEELKKEKELAISYLNAKKKFINSKGTLLKNEIEKLSKQLEKLILDNTKFNDIIKQKEALLEDVEKKIKKIDEERALILKEVESKQKQQDLIKEIENLRIFISKSETELSEKRELFERIKSNIEEITNEKNRCEEEIKNIEIEYKSILEELKKIKPISAQIKEKAQSDLLENKLKELKKEIETAKEKLIKVESELEFNKARLESFNINNETIETFNEEELKKEIKEYKETINFLKEKIASLFEEEKLLNERVAEIDKKLVDLREKIASLRAYNIKTAQSNLQSFITEIKKKNPNVYGFIYDLIKFDPKYSLAIEAAAGQRLLYIVVKDVKTALSLIEKIKENDLGRATFLPLDLIKHSEAFERKNISLLNFIEYSKEILKAVEFVFGDTLLVEDVKEAEKIGIGKYRIVTLSGELFEKSGLITGGRFTSSLAISMQLLQLEKEIENLKMSREEEMQKIKSIREEINSLRNEKAEIEIKLRTKEIEIKHFEENKIKIENEKKKLNEEKEKIKNHITFLQREREKLLFYIDDINKKINEYEEKLHKTKEEEEKNRDEIIKRTSEENAKIALLNSKKDHLFSLISLKKEELSKLIRKYEQLNNEKNVIREKIGKLERIINENKNILAEKESAISLSSEKISKFFEEIKKRDEFLQELGKEKGKISFEIEKLKKEQNKLAVEKATLETKLIDLTSELSSLGEFEYLNLSREELIQNMKESESFLNSNQNVNLASIELYDKKFAEIEEVKKKIDKLNEEKEAVIKLINEIENKKKDAFFNTFNAINKNFKNMFNYIPWIGEGTLYLDKPSEPFESALYIKIKRGGKEIGIESLSGGETSLIALMLIFAMQFTKPSPFYILDEVDAALDKENSKNLAKLLKEMSANTQFLVVSHNDIVVSYSSAVFGISKINNISQAVSLKLVPQN